MADWVVDLGTQLYGKREFAVYGSVGDTFWRMNTAETWCCWHSFIRDYATEYGSGAPPTVEECRERFRMSPWTGGVPDDRPRAEFIPERCEECAPDDSAS